MPGVAADAPPAAAAERTGTAAIRFEHVSLAFEGRSVIEDVSFTVARGETKILLGEAGSGKTVLLKLALGLLRPSSGRIFIHGTEISALAESALYEVRRGVGITFQESALFDSLTVRENVAFRLVEEGRLDEAAIEERVRTCLRFVELEPAIDQLPAELSGGMRHRVSIARALATSPTVMLFDSPTGGLDPITATTIVELILKLRDTERVTSLIATHRLQDGYLLATHVWDRTRNTLRRAPTEASHTSFLLLARHRVWFDGNAAELEASTDPYLREFLG